MRIIEELLVDAGLSEVMFTPDGDPFSVKYGRLGSPASWGCSSFGERPDAVEARLLAGGL